MEIKKVVIDVSVIIPIYQGRRYLKYWLDILADNFKNYQKVYKMQCEAIIVNDYPDEKLELEEKTIDIAVYNLEKNRGIHGARIFGFYKAKGNYIVFLDQDDRITNNYLVSQRKLIGRADAVVCNGYIKRLCIEGGRIIYKEEQLEKIKVLDNFIQECNLIVSPGQVLIKRKSIPQLWLSKIMHKNGADDYFLWIVMLSQKSLFNVNNQMLYEHIETGKNTSNQIGDMVESILEMTFILQENNILQENEIDKIVERASLLQKDKKNLKLFKMIKVYDYWMYLNIRNKRIEIYFNNHNYKKIAIYGMNYIGNRLYDELLNSSVEIVFGIDKEGDSIIHNIPVLKREDSDVFTYIEKIDIIVVTAIDAYQEILSDMQSICNKYIVSIEDIFVELINFSI